MPSSIMSQNSEVFPITERMLRASFVKCLFAHSLFSATTNSKLDVNSRSLHIIQELRFPVDDLILDKEDDGQHIAKVFHAISCRHEFHWPQNMVVTIIIQESLPFVPTDTAILVLKGITYVYLSGNGIQQRKVDEVMEYWTYYSNLSFKKVDSGGHLRISLNDSDVRGSWSYLGTRCLRVLETSPTMNIQGISSTSSRLSNTERMAILHESGHALGFLHEHQSPARSGKLTFNECKYQAPLVLCPFARPLHAVVYEYFRIMEGWSDKVTRDNVTQVVEEREIDNYTEFDTKSIMM